MPEEKKAEDLQKEVIDTLSAGLFKAGEGAKGVLICIAMNDDSIWYGMVGHLVTKLGLTKHAEMNTARIWDKGESIDDEDEEEA